MDGRRNPFLCSFHSFSLWGALVQTFTTFERSFLCMPILPLHSERGLFVPFAGAGLVRLAREIRVWRFHRSYAGSSNSEVHSSSNAQGMGSCPSVVSSGQHGMRHHAFSSPWLPLYRSSSYALH